MRNDRNVVMQVVDVIVSTIRDVLYFVGRVILAILGGGA
jgi:hypothetical protein